MSTIDKIMKLLEVQKKSQKDLTDYLDIDKSTFSQWKNGKSQSYNKYIVQIAHFLETTPSDLLDWNSSGKLMGDTLRSILEEKGMSEEELSIKTGYPVESIIKYENGERKFTDTVTYNFIKALELPEDDESLFPHTGGFFDFRDDIDLEIDEMTHTLNHDGKKRVVEYLKDLIMIEKYTTPKGAML